MKIALQKLFTFLLPLSFLLIPQISYAQTIDASVEGGTYGAGSDITVLMTFTSEMEKFDVTNKFELYLSNPGGVFSGSKKIGEFEGFYTSYINGKIPDQVTDGDNYKLEIRSTKPDKRYQVAGTFNIRNQQAPVSIIHPHPKFPEIKLTEEVFGWCGPSVKQNNDVMLVNGSSPEATTVLSFKNEVSQDNLASKSPNPDNNFSLSGIKIAYYTMTISAVKNINGELIQSRRSYLLTNTHSYINIQSNGGDFGCIEQGSSTGVPNIFYTVNNSGNDGIQFNHPSTRYLINWGDGDSKVITHAQLLLNRNLSHEYRISSCDQPPIDLGGGMEKTNAFRVSLSAITDYCSGTNAATTYPQIFIKPKALFKGPENSCVNSTISFFNDTDKGNSPGPNGKCTTETTFKWYINDELVSYDEHLDYTFKKPGLYNVKLTASNGVTTCGESAETKTICIEEPPAPKFTFTKSSVCAPTIITTNNLTPKENQCDPFTYLWEVIPDAQNQNNNDVEFVNSTSNNSENPVIKIANDGKYTLKLTVSNSCGPVTHQEALVVSGNAKVSLPPAANYCRAVPYTIDFGSDPLHKVVYSGTSEKPVVRWEITGGAYAFVSGSATSLFPQIEFREVGTYTVKVSYNNECNIESTSIQTITFHPAIVVDAGPDAIVCGNMPGNQDISYTFKGNLPLPTEIGKWTVVSGPNADKLVFSNASKSDARVTNLIPGTYVFKWTISNPNCIDGEGDEMTLTVYPNPVGGSVTGPGYVCINGNGALGLTGYSGKVIEWQSSTDNKAWSPIPDSETSTYNFSNLQQTTYYRVKIGSDSPNCPDTFVYSEKGAITVDPPSVGGITSTATPAVCAAPNTGNITLSGHVGKVLYWQSSPNGINWYSLGSAGLTSFTFSDIKATTLYRAAVQNGQCPLAYSDPVTITVNPLAAVADAGNDQALCNAAETILSGNNPGTASGEWTLESAQPGIVFEDATKFNTKVSGLKAGETYEFKWTISGAAPCPPTSDIVRIVVEPPSVGGATSTTRTDVCAGVNSGTITLSGQTGVITAWQSSPNGTSWQNISGSNSATYTFNGLTQTTHYRAVVQNGSCPPAFSTPTVIHVAPGVDMADAGKDQFLCNVSESVLDANIPVNGTGTWTKISGPATAVIEDPSNAKSKIKGLSVGTYVFQWSITNNICDPSTATVTIRNLPSLTNSIATTITSLCSGVPVTVTGDDPTGGNGNYSYEWLMSTDNATWKVISQQTQKDLHIILPTADYQLKRVVTSGPCSMESNAVKIAVQPPVSNNTLKGEQAVCTGTPVALIAGSTPLGGDGKFSYQWQMRAGEAAWTNIPGATGKDYQPPVLTKTTLYRRMVSTSLCAGSLGSASNEVKITVNEDAKAEFNASALIGCVPFDLSTVISPVPYDDRNATYEWFADGVSIGTGSDFPGHTITSDGKEVVIKLVTTSKFGCKPDSKELSFKTIKNVVASFTKDQAQGCGPLTVNFINTSSPLTTGNYVWDFGNGEKSTLQQPGAVTFAPHPENRDTTYMITLRAYTNCQETIYTDSVLVRPRPKAIFSPDKTIGCSPFTVRITNQSRGIPNTYTFDFGNGEKITKTDNLAFDYTFTTTKTDTFTVKLYAENECGKDSTSYDIVVYPNTVEAELVVNGKNLSGCAPFTVDFDNNSTGANSFIWDFGDGTTFNTTKSPERVSHTFTKPGTYTVVLRASNGCSEATTTETVEVLAQPVALFETEKWNYCIGEAIAFTNKSESGTSYLWDFADGNTSNEVNPKHSFDKPGKYTIKLTAFQSYRDGTTCSSTYTREVEILPLPTANFITNATQLNCTPFKLAATASPFNASNVEWDFGDEGSADNKAAGFSAEHIFKKAGIYQVRAIAYNLSGCADTSIQVIQITETPVAAFTTTDTLICGPSAKLDFTNQTVYGGKDLVSYKWLVNNKMVSTAKDFSYNFSTPANELLPYKFEVKLIATSTIGCPDTAKQIIQFNPLPKADFNTAVTIDCSPFRVVVNNLSQYADRFSWYLNDVLVSGEKTPQDIVLNEPGTEYRLKLVAENIYGCTLSSIEKIIKTHPRPAASFTLQEAVSCNGILDIKVTNTTTGASSYTWNFGDGSPELTSLTPTHTYGVPGVYTLRLVAFNGLCRDTVTQTVSVSSPPKAAFIANTTTGCTSASVTFQNLSENAQEYLWDFGDGTFSNSKNPKHTFTYMQSPYTVTLIATGEYGCADTTVMVNYITITPPPKADFTVLPDSVIKIPDYTFGFKNSSSPEAVKFKWLFGDGKSSEEKDPSHTYMETGTYEVQLIAFNEEGCTDTLKRTVAVNGVDGYLYVPNAFEPGSPKPELKTFKPKGSGIAEYSLTIFNKWGEVVFQTNKLDADGVPEEGWDGSIAGSPAPQGVYVWSISAKYIDGTEWKGMKYQKGTLKKAGSVTLIR